MNKISVFGKIIFILIFLIFAVAFFLYKQYMFSFLTLIIILIISRWDRVKKLIAGRGRVEVQIEKDKDIK